jgi:hypothetical protein
MAHARQGQGELKLARVAKKQPGRGGAGIKKERGQGEEQSGDDVFATHDKEKGKRKVTISRFMISHEGHEDTTAPRKKKDPLFVTFEPLCLSGF